MEEIEELANYAHEAYRKTYPRGAKPNPNDIPFENLPDDKQESNRSSVRSTLVALAGLGDKLVRCTPGTHSATTVPADQHGPLKRLEHDRWLREVLQNGWDYGNPS